MLTCNEVTASAADKLLFNKVSISILPGSILYIRGSNGSGKTSFLRILSNIQPADSGSVYWYGEAINDLDNYCTYIGHKLAIKPELTAIEHLEFWGQIYNSKEAIAASIAYFNLYDILDKPCYFLSAGEKKRVAISRLLISNNDLWILDEVDTNLDEENAALLYRAIISKRENGGVVIIASHRYKEHNSLKSQELLLADFNG